MKPQSLVTLPVGLLAGGLLYCVALGGTTDGSCLEDWELENFQPQSPSYGQLVHSSSYHARTTVVMLLSSG